MQSLVNAARTLGLTLGASLWRVVLPRVVNSKRLQAHSLLHFMRYPILVRLQ